MLRKLISIFVVVYAAAPAWAQVSVTFQQEVNGYLGTVDTTFRAADPLGQTSVPPPDIADFVSVDEFDGGFQTQGALRFEGLFGGAAGQVPNGVTIAFATLTVSVGSASDADAVIGFHRVLPASPWVETSTWFSLGGDLIPDPITGLLDGDPILQNNVESLTTPDALVPTPDFSDGFLDIDVTDSIEAWYGNEGVGGAPNLGWAINNNTGNGWDFDSSEFVDAIDPLDFSRRPLLTIGFFLLQGDLDFDSDVDLDDYDFLLGNLAVQLNGPIAQGSFGDLDFDRDVDLDDFSIFKDLYPGGAGGLADALSARASVPEPSAVVLAILALCGLACRRFRTNS